MRNTTSNAMLAAVRADKERLQDINDHLLFALENLMAKLEIMNGCNPHDMNGEYPWPEFDAARAAIAKAEGTS